MSKILKAEKKRVAKLEKEVEDLTKKRDEKCEPIAAEVIQIIARHKIDPKFFEDNEEKAKLYGPAQVEINELMKSKGLTINETNYTWTIVQSVVTNIQNMSVSAIKIAFEVLQTKTYGVDDINDITLQNIDSMLQSK